MPTANKKLVQKNKNYIRCLIDIAIYLEHWKISFCEHIEDEESLNKGNLG